MTIYFCKIFLIRSICFFFSHFLRFYLTVLAPSPLCILKPVWLPLTSRLVIFIYAYTTDKRFSSAVADGDLLMISPWVLHSLLTQVRFKVCWTAEKKWSYRSSSLFLSEPSFLFFRLSLSCRLLFLFYLALFWLPLFMGLRRRAYFTFVIRGVCVILFLQHIAFRADYRKAI